MKISIFSRKKGDQSSFEELLAPHIEPLFRLGYRLTGSEFEAEDLVQELLAKLYPRQKEMLAVENLRPWLSRVLHNLHIDGLRKKQRSPLDYGHDGQLDEQSHDVGPASCMALTQLQKRIIQALDELNEDQRVLVVMHDVESYTLAEISEILDVPIGTLKSRLHRSRARLKKILADGTISLEEAC